MKNDSAYYIVIDGKIYLGIYQESSNSFQTNIGLVSQRIISHYQDIPKPTDNWVESRNRIVG